MQAGSEHLQAAWHMPIVATVEHSRLHANECGMCAASRVQRTTSDGPRLALELCGFVSPQFEPRPQPRPSKPAEFLVDWLQVGSTSEHVLAVVCLVRSPHATSRSVYQHFVPPEDYLLSLRILRQIHRSLCRRRTNVATSAYSLRALIPLQPAL